MKKGAGLFFVIVFSLLFVSFVSAGWFNDFFGKGSITGNAIVGGTISTNASGTVNITNPTLDGNKLHIKPESAGKMCELFGYANYTGYAEHNEVGALWVNHDTWTITYGVSGSTNASLVLCDNNGLWSYADCRYVAKLLKCTPPVSVTPTPYCIDSDGGWNPNVQGSLTQFTGQVNATNTDFCYNVSHVREYSCERENTNYGINDRISFCSGGCSNGACINATQTNTTYFCTDSDGNNTFVKGNVSYGTCTSSGNSGGCSGNVAVDSCFSLISGNYSYEYLCGNATTPSNRIASSVNLCINGCTDGACNVPSQLQVCQELIDKVKSPSSFTDAYGVFFELTQNDTWDGSYDTNPYTVYSAGWNANNNDMHYYIYYSVQAYDDKNLNASSLLYLSDTCVERNIGGQTVYVCNYDLLSDDRYNYNQIFWANDNVLVMAYVSSSTNNINDEELENILNRDVQSFLNDIRDNRYKSTYDSFDVDYHLSNILSDDLITCNSDLSIGVLPYSWECKLEPVVCPEYGYQNQICIGYGNNGQQERREQQIYCSPGICSGCYIPRWEGSNDNICIPYGTRILFPDNENGRVYESEFNNNLEFTLTIVDDTSGNIVLNENITNEVSSIVVNGQEFFGIAGESYTFYEGNDYNIAINGPENNPYREEISLTVTSIVYSDDASKRYLDIRLNEEYPAYCNYDGNIYKQKTIDYSNNWAKCQNNYECESNICSSGECIELKAIAEEAIGFKGTVIKFLCRLSNPFSDDGYNQCLAEYLGY